MKKQNLTLLLVSIFIFVFIWIGFNIYHNSSSSTISPSVKKQLSPISPNFDTKTIEQLKKRENVIPLFESGNPVVVPSITPTATQPISTESANQATPGGSLLP